jgi:phosphatidylserine/phosphatidylglycerophosphate/cardiolipin synthase-like enzyme
MTEVVRPSWNILESLVANAESKLFICSPWIATHGVGRIKSYLSSKDLKSGFREIEFWCRLADCNTDSAALLSFANQCNENGISTVLKDSAALHAKIYLADQRQVLLTSANLSFQRFEQNLELGLLTDDALVIRQTLEMLDAMSRSMQLVTIEQLTYLASNIYTYYRA